MPRQLVGCAGFVLAMLGGACSSKVASCDCQVSQVCVAGSCRDLCETDSYCTAGELCIEGVCGPCTADGQCEDGNVCTVDACSAGGTCAHDPVPRQGSPCAVNQPGDGVCMLLGPAVGECRLLQGGVCTDGLQCAAGLCVHGRCCNSACAGNCQRCNAPGSEGTCLPFSSLCIGNCDTCGVSGNCEADVSSCAGNCSTCTEITPTRFDCAANAAACTGNCDVCNGSGSDFNCQPDQAACPASGATLCTTCTGGMTSYNCSYDPSQTVDDCALGYVCAAAGSCALVGVAAGGGHVCALLPDGAVKCWGNGGYGQLGDGATTSSPTPVAAISGALTIAVGFFHSCAVLSNGSVWCWGLNNHGQLGNGTNFASSVPVAVSGITTAVQIASSEHTTCARLSDGSVRCWGLGSYGQLGNGTTTSSSTPVTVSGLTGVVYVSGAGPMFGSHHCAVLIDGTARCWGYNFSGPLGNGTETNSSIPVVVTGLTGATRIAGGVYHTCAVISGAQPKCWGSNWNGELFVGSLNPTKSTVPVVASALSAGVTLLAAASGWGCAISSTAAQCVGHGLGGELGNGGFASSATPVAITGVTGANVVSLTAGNSVGCVMMTDYSVKCWGTGYLGDGQPSQSSAVPVTVVGL